MGGVDMSIICCDAERGLVVDNGGDVEGDGGCGSIKVSNASMTRFVEQECVRGSSEKSTGLVFPATEDDFD